MQLPSITKYAWSKLTTMQLGHLAEHIVKVEFFSYGFDVYTPGVDHHGVDFMARQGHQRAFDIQVKGSREQRSVLIPKEKLILRADLYLALVLFCEGQAPEVYLINTLTAWEHPDATFSLHPGIKSPPEWAVNFSGRHRERLKDYLFDAVILGLCG